MSVLTAISDAPEPPPPDESLERLGRTCFAKLAPAKTRRCLSGQEQWTNHCCGGRRRGGRLKHGLTAWVSIPSWPGENRGLWVA